MSIGPWGLGVSAVAMRRVLVVSYYAPPLGLSGVMRVTKLCKYLPEHGWEPLLLTVKPPAYYYYDPELLSDLARTRIYRTESLDPARLLNLLRPPKSRLAPMFGGNAGTGPRVLNYLMFPDSRVGWYPFALVAGRRIIDREKPAAVFATGPPFTALLLGVLFKKYGALPLVADFRDPWPTGFAPPPRHLRALLQAARERILRRADAVLAVNEGTAGRLGPEARVLDNGFDPAEFEVQPARLEGFSIVHVGNLWQNQQEMFDVCRAAAQIPDARVYLAGRVDDSTAGQLAQYPQVRMLGSLPHREVCALMRAADVLLYVGKPKQPVGLKLYEYLGARRPILVYGPDTAEAAGIVEQCGAGVVCAGPESLGQSVARLRAESEVFTKGNRDRYDRRRQAERLAGLLEELAAGRVS